MKKNKKKTILIIIAALAAIAIGGYLIWAFTFPVREVAKIVAPVQKPTDETANWKTYKTDYGFEFQYPQNSSVVKETSEELSSDPQRADDQNKDFLMKYITSYTAITVFRTSEPDVRAWLKKTYPNDSTILPGLKNIDNANGIEVVESKNSWGDNSYTVKLDDKILLISLMDSSGNQIKDNQLLLNIAKSIEKI